MRTCVAAVALSALGWLTISVDGALTAPGTDTAAARLAEWGRVHHLGWVVTALEREQYAAHKPKTGGTVPGGVPTVAPLQVYPGAPSRTHQLTPAPKPTLPGSYKHARQRPQIAAAPAPMRPVAPGRLAGEGHWQDLLRVHGKPAARVAFLRPDRIHTAYLADVVWMDPNLLTFKLFPGYQVPGRPLTAPDQLRGKQRNAVLGTFNSGFQMADANGGYWQNGKAIAPLRLGAASMVFTKDGKLRIESWPGGTPGPRIAAIRQNLVMLIRAGKVSPLVASPTTKTWGTTVGNQAYVWRSGIGIRKDGTIVFALGPAMDIRALATVLKRAGAVDAMECDINPDWTNYLTYTHPARGQAIPHRLGNDTYPSLVRYLKPSSRDFVGVFGR